jgi:hypothetical protein
MAAEPERKLVHVTLSGGRSGEYVITEERPGERHMTPEESAAFWAEHGPHIGPPDGEG